MNILFAYLISYFSNSGADFQIKDLRRQLEKAQDDVYKIEKEKDELSVKVEEADKALEEVKLVYVNFFEENHIGLSVKVSF